MPLECRCWIPRHIYSKYSIIAESSWQTNGPPSASSNISLTLSLSWEKAYNLMIFSWSIFLWMLISRCICLLLTSLKMPLGIYLVSALYNLHGESTAFLLHQHHLTICAMSKFLYNCVLIEIWLALWTMRFEPILLSALLWTVSNHIASRAGYGFHLFLRWYEWWVVIVA